MSIITIRTRGLGPLKQPTEIEIKPFMVFSGPSGMGKSYMALLVHFVYCVIVGNKLFDFFAQIGADYEECKKIQEDEEVIILTFSNADFKAWLNEEAVKYMGQMLGNPDFHAEIDIDMPGIDDRLQFSFVRNKVLSSGGGETVNYYENIRIVGTDYELNLPQNFNSWKYFPFYMLFSQYLKEKFDIRLEQTFLMPPSRGAMVTLSDSDRLLLQQSMGMYQEFIHDLSFLKASLPRNASQSDSVERTRDLLRGDIKIKDNDMVFVMPDAEIPITATASSVKELAAFALMIQKGLFPFYSILFEEPESHLHPELQVQTADLIAHAIDCGAHIQITTHSDYLLRRINDLMRLHELKERMKEDDFKDFCLSHGFSPEVTIDPSVVRAYYLHAAEDGTSAIIKQDTSEGIPFKTFEKVIDNQLTNSATLYELWEDLCHERTD